MILISQELRNFAAETIAKNMTVYYETAFSEFKVYYPDNIYFILRYWHKDKCFVAHCTHPKNHMLEVRKDIDKETAIALIEEVLPQKISDDIWMKIVEGFTFLTINIEQK